MLECKQLLIQVEFLCLDRETGGPLSMGLQRVEHNRVANTMHVVLRGTGAKEENERSRCLHLCIPAAELVNFNESEKKCSSDADLI